MDICAFTSLCEEDVIWVPQYLKEVERLNIDFAIHLDRCSKATANLFTNHPSLVSITYQDDHRIEFDETHKQLVFNKVYDAGYQWAMAWDIDETYAPSFSVYVTQVLSRANDIDYVNIKWVNLWNDKEHIRVDGPFQSGHRDKFYNLRSGRWEFMNKTVNGPKLLDSKGRAVGDKARRLNLHELVCLHWGMMTRELREQHKARWDRIYTKAVGRNPYGFWSYALDEATYPPVIHPNPYLPLYPYTR